METCWRRWDGDRGVDSEGTLTTINAAAARLLDIDVSLAGRPVEQVLGGRSARRSSLCCAACFPAARRGAARGAPARGQRGRPAGPVLPRGRVCRLAQGRRPGRTRPPTGGDGGGAGDGARTRGRGAPGGRRPDPAHARPEVAAWGEVARKLAHEIKNPLTPIQLSASGSAKAYLRSAPDFERVLTECTTAIVEEVEALKTLVDEFTQFARLPAVQRVSASLHDVIEQTLPLYDGQFVDVRFDRRLARICRRSPSTPTDEARAHQPRRQRHRAMDKKGTVSIFTEFDRSQSRVRLAVADNGPGIPAGARDKLFVPISPPRNAGAVWGSPSSTASCRSTRAPSASRTTCRAGPASWWRSQPSVHSPKLHPQGATLAVRLRSDRRVRSGHHWASRTSMVSPQAPPLNRGKADRAKLTVQATGGSRPFGRLRGRVRVKCLACAVSSPCRSDAASAP